MKSYDYRIAIDTGGTFVDAVELNDDGHFKLAKFPTNVNDPANSVLRVIEKLGTPLQRTYMIIYGTTLGINAIIQRKGATTGLITNKGFRDILEIGRGDVPPKFMYDMNYVKPKPLIKRRHIVGIGGRIDYKGEIVQELDAIALRHAVTRLVQDGVQSLAICFLHSYKNPKHEYEALSIIHESLPQLPVSLSCDVAREYREYERTVTTVIDAYVKPIMSNHILRLHHLLREKGFKGLFLIMRSDGGAMSTETATRSPIKTIQSGPAGGVIATVNYAKLLNLDKLISVDFGGTSMDACVVVDRQANVTHQTQVENYPLLLTSYDIRSIGAGGGSKAYLDHGILKVGPESAGAEPGPMCYNRGGVIPTVTDAAVCLGYIDPRRFLNGEMPLNEELAWNGIANQIAQPLGISVREAAAGIFRILVANSSAAVRAITVEEGLDPGEFTMLAFGGAGPMIAPLLARELDIPRVIVPVAPANFSALGMLFADIKSELSITLLEKLDEALMKKIESLFVHMEERLLQVISDLKKYYLNIEIRRSLEMRYVGQEHVLEIDASVLHPGIMANKFNEQHLRRYGHSMDYDIEVVNARLVTIGVLNKPRIYYPFQSADGEFNLKRKAFCLISDQTKTFNVVKRGSLKNGDTIEGPAIIDEGISTTVLHTGQISRVDQHGNLVIDV
ncbi:MAG: hydantoinase/oxoprolinase family protein [Thermoproteota archaeon]